MVDAHDGILEEVRVQLQAVVQVEKYWLWLLERLTTGRLFGLVGGIVLGDRVLTFSSSVGEIGDALRDVSWGFLPALVVLAFVPYLTGAVSLLGVSPKSLPIVEVTELMLGQSFLNKFTPANAAGMALRVRYLQKEGIDVVQAGAGVGLTSLANGIVQAVALVAFGFWARSATDVGFHIPEASLIALVVGVLLIAAGVVWLTPWGRRMFAPRLGVAWSSVMALLATIAHQPSKSVQLFGGALAGKIVDRRVHPHVRSLRHRPRVLASRLPVPDGHHGCLGGSDARWPRCRRGHVAGRPDRRRRPVGHRDVRDHRVPTRHLLAPRPPRLARPHPDAPPELV